VIEKAGTGLNKKAYAKLDEFSSELNTLLRLAGAEYIYHLNE
jgi:hypothetical protein